MPTGRRLGAIGGVVVALAHGQFTNLATSPDGADYFSSEDSVRQRGTNQSLFRQKAFVVRDGRVSLIDEARERVGPALWTYAASSLSSDGSVRALNRLFLCVVIGCRLAQNDSNAVIETPSRTFYMPGTARISANGRFASLTPLRRGTVHLLDLTTLQVAPVGESAGWAWHPVADDGTVVVRSSSNPARLALVGPNGERALSTPFASSAELSADSRRLIYSDPAGFHFLDLETGNSRPLGAGIAFAMTPDAARFSYIRPVDSSPVFYPARDRQVWLGNALTGEVRRLSDEPEGIASHALSSDGRRAVAATNSGRIVSIETATGATTELLGSPGPGMLFTVAVPGSYTEIIWDFPEGTPPRLRIDGAPAIPLGSSERGFSFQVPWEARSNSTAVLTLEGGEPAWERRLLGTVQEFYGIVLPIGPLPGPKTLSGTIFSFGRFPRYAYHQDGATPVDSDNPAKPGETIRFLGTGWGSVDGNVRTGEPTPGDRPYRTTMNCEWWASANPAQVDQARKIEPVFVGLAPGLTGVYQLDFRVPEDWKEISFHPFCWCRSGSNRVGAATATIEVQPMPMAPESP